MHGGCACHQPVGYISYGRACPENTGRANWYHYQYRTYVPSPPPGYHVEDLPYPAAHESVRQPELHAIPVQQGPVRFRPIPTRMGQSKLVLHHLPQFPWSRHTSCQSQLKVSLWMKLLPIRPQRDPSVPYAHSPSIKDDERRVSLRSSKRPKRVRG